MSRFFNLYLHSAYDNPTKRSILDTDISIVFVSNIYRIDTENCIYTDNVNVVVV